MRQCVYCGARAGLFGRICGDCKRLAARVDALRGKVVDGEGHAMRFNRQPAKHRGVVAAGAALTPGLQGLWASAMADK